MLSEAPLIFTTNSLDNLTNRIDVHFFDPRYLETLEKLEQLSKKKKIGKSLLGDLLDKKSKTSLTGGATPKGAIYLTEGIKFIRVQNVKENYIDLENAVHIDRNTHENLLGRSKLKPKDILLSITGSYGIASVVPETIGEANINQHCVKIEVNKQTINPYFLSYYVNSQLCRRQMDRAVTGSSRPALDYSAIKALVVIYPKTTNKQGEIVEAIKKIEKKALQMLNRAHSLARKDIEIISSELEVNFAPNLGTKHFAVSPTKLEDRLDAIYHDPDYDRLIDTLEGCRYELKPLQEIAPLSLETINPIEYPNRLFKLVELEDIDGELGEISSFKEFFGVEIKSQKRHYQSNDILLSRLRYYLRKVVVVPKKFEEGLGTTELFVLKPTDEVNSYFLVTMLRHPLVVEQANHKPTGSTRPRLTRKDTKQLLIPFPPHKVQEKIAKKIARIKREIAQLRLGASALLEQSKQKLEKELQTAS